MLIGENNAIIDDFFFQMSYNFDIMTTSNRNDDIVNHLDVFQPDILIYCMNADSVKDFNRMYFLNEKLKKKGILLGVIGTKELCKEFEKIAFDSADIMLETPLTANKIMSKIQVFIGKKRSEQLEKEEKQKLIEEKEEHVTEIQKKHILVIDDDPMMLKLVNEQLHERYNVATAISGKLAFTFLEKNIQI
mgnify:CR=1 FL=1